MQVDAITEVYLMPGEYFVGGPNYRIRTVLGSCVSITLWHPGLRIGAMSHYLLSEREPGMPRELNGRYGRDALELMVRELRERGVRIKDCQAKVFGGGTMFPHVEGRSQPAVGYRNGEAAERLLAEYGIRVVSESLFGTGHRQILFDVATGDVWMRHGEKGCA